MAKLSRAQELAQEAKTLTGAVQLPDDARKFVEECVAINDAEPNRLKRIRAGRVIEVLAQDFGVSVSRDIFDRWIRGNLDRRTFTNKT